MKRWLCVLLMVFCSLGVAWAKDSGARFSSLTGEVETRPEEDEKAWKFSKLNTVLNVMDHVKTGQESSAIIGFADLSTFLLKAESEVVITTPPEKDSKVKLVAGNIWVNVKKMVKEGTMEVEMSQAVAGIKGTNITCETNAGRTEDRITVLRGMADIIINETQEHIALKEGEELVVKTGGKTEKQEIDIQAEQDKWKIELSHLGDSIELNEIPDTLRQIQQNDGATFKGVQDRFRALSAAEKPSTEDVREFGKDAERFVGVLMEDSIIVAAIQGKIDRLLAGGDLPASKKALMTNYMKMVSESKKMVQGFQAEIGKMLKFQFKTAATTEGDLIASDAKKLLTAEINAEAGQLGVEVATVWGDVESLLREVQSSAGGLSQDWFEDAVSKCNQALTSFAVQAQSVQALLDRESTNAQALALSKQIAGYQSQIGGLLRDFAVVKIDPSTLTEFQQIDDVLSASIVSLRSLIDSYNSTAGKATQDETRLRASLQILNDFGKAKRQYTNAQRLYETTSKAGSGQKYRTAEQEEMTQTFDRISNTYQQLGITAEELQTRLQDLESQLGKYLK